VWGRSGMGTSICPRAALYHIPRTFASCGLEPIHTSVTVVKWSGNYSFFSPIRNIYHRRRAKLEHANLLTNRWL